MILIVDMNWKKSSLGYYEFVLSIASIAKSLDKYAVKHYLEVTKKELTQFDVVILSGTALKDTATLSQLEKFKWLKETDKPVFGICAGMETIGIVYGAHLTNCLEIGMTQVNAVKENPIFSGSLRAYSLHSLCVEPSSEFEVWAESNKCAQIIKLKKKPIYGLLFHPEVRNPELIKRFIQLNKTDP
ncbi:MAG TPA: gamma-glutamyl-gamma-aminobutyrate hydrolase family protein [Candidatus Limnocylindrales bacterium]|nr:gamma-glutamyl-gamma-aminobutyrate hydrolase family protein [Candidatus Limnocylindrales bacterium]